MNQSQEVDEVKSHTGWFKAMRTDDASELIAAHPLAYVLAAVIALRARWRDGFNRHGLGPGEAMLGDFKQYGMTEKQYRTAKKFLEKFSFAAFRRTNKGTVAKLIDTRLFYIVEVQPGGRVGGQRANDGRSAGGRVGGQRATNEERIDEKNTRTIERLNDAKGTTHRNLKTPPPRIHRLSVAFERELMARLRALLGDDEMARAGANWRKNWVRKSPSIVEAGLNELDKEINEGKDKRNRAAWLVDWCKRTSTPTPGKESI